MIQDLFDDLGVLQRVIDGDVHVFWHHWKRLPNPGEVGLPPGSVSVGLRFVWPEARYQFTTHCYVTPNGDLAKSAMLDPKTMRYGEEVLFEIN